MSLIHPQYDLYLIRSHTVYLLLLCCALALAVAVVWLGIVRAFAKTILEISLVATVVLNIGICICEFGCSVRAVPIADVPGYFIRKCA